MLKRGGETRPFLFHGGYMPYIGYFVMIGLLGALWLAFDS